ncbi:helix-turn-helix domain-containing protein [candidate division GN15 bacterium]|nr:helix-turn-helix domain-containing protein [candidate division GN15 bacterium]
MTKKYLTTTEAARILSVSADTVLKWVRAGKLASYRTPGGHCRILPEAIDSMVPGGKASAEVAVQPTPAFEYCWEYNAKSGEICGQCQECIVYQSRARRCYEFRDLPEEFGHLRLHCDSTCDNCEYFLKVSEQGTNVLVVSRNKQTINQLHRERTSRGFEVRFAMSEYEVSAVVESFRPDYVVVDTSLGARQTQSLCQHMLEDSRIPVTRIILASKEEIHQENCGREVLGWLRKPFNVQQLQSLIADIRAPKSVSA